MKNIVTGFLLGLCVIRTSLAQEIKMQAELGVEDKVINYILDFQNISIEHFKFYGEGLKGKVPIITLKEFKKGKLIKTETLFNGEESRAHFEIDSSYFDFRFFASLDNENRQFKTWIRAYRFGAGRKQYVLTKDKFGYAMKDFFGGKKELMFGAKDEIPLLAIITPHKQENGWGSYCEVVQSGVKPEDLGKHFGIPHYFLVTVSFK